MSRFVLFDLDNTLVDSVHLKALRNKRAWSAVYARIGSIALFDGIGDVWAQLRRDERIYLGVVTHSPRPYAERVLAHVGLEPDTLIAYHDLQGKRKPHPFGYERCADGRSPVCGVAVGDEEADLRAADAFGCQAALAGWARGVAITEAACAARGWTFLRTPAELLALVAHLPTE
jgi:phosphoglycolate phosphatase-like HAD superfamily hydrolase